MGMVLTHTCSHGSKEVKCNVVGHWEVVVDDCSCAADGIWEEAALGTTTEIICENNGRLRRTCKSDGYWEQVQNFNCRCPADGIWRETPAGEYARAGCGNGFVERLCGLDGHWTEVYDRSSCCGGWRGR